MEYRVKRGKVVILGGGVVGFNALKLHKELEHTQVYLIYHKNDLHILMTCLVRQFKRCSVTMQTLNRK